MLFVYAVAKKTEEKLSAIDEQILAIDASIAELKLIDSQIKLSIAELETKADNSNEQIDAINEIIDILRNKDSELEGKITALENDVTALKEKTSKNEDSIKTINATIGELKDVDGQLKGFITELETKAASTTERIDIIDDVIDEIKNRVDNLKSRIDTLEEVADALTDRVSKNENDITEILERLNDLEQLNESLQKRIDCLEGKHHWDLDSEDSFYEWGSSLSQCKAHLKCENCQKLISISSEDITYDNYALTATFPESTNVPAHMLDITDMRSYYSDSIVTAVNYMLSSGSPESAEIKLTLASVPNDENVFDAIRNAINDYRYEGDMDNYNIYQEGLQNGALKLYIAGVNTISENAFFNCEWLGELTIGDGVNILGGTSFAYCYKLASVTMADDLQIIGQHAFYYCQELRSVTFGDGVFGIDCRAFEYCESLENVTFGEKLQIIDEWAFSNCTSLKTLTLPDYVYEIKNGAFEGCSALESIVIGRNLTSLLENNIFGSCNALTDIRFTAPLTEVGFNAFDSLNTENITLTLVQEQEILTEGNEYWQSNSEIFNGGNEFCGRKFAKIVIAVTIDASEMNGTELSAAVGKAVTGGKTNIHILLSSTASSEEFLAIKDGLSKTKDLVTLKISGATAIPENAFLQVTNIKSITIGDEATSIGANAFDGCTALTDIHMGNNVKTIGNNAFYYCENMQSIYIPSSISTIGSTAFCGSALNNVYYGGELDDWMKIRFSDIYSNPCSDEAKLYFNGKLVENITISNVTAIQNNAFYGCSSLKSVILEEGVNILGDSAFELCKSLEKISIPSSLTRINVGAFRNTSISTIVLPDSVTYLGACVFADCYYLESVTFGRGISELPYATFLFTGCQNLEAITFKGQITSMTTDLFENVNTQEITLTLAKGQKELSLLFGSWLETDQLFSDGNEFCGETFKKIIVPVTINASGMSSDELGEALTQMVLSGKQDITIQFGFDANNNHFGAICNAISNGEYGTINLTIDGVSTVAGDAFYNCPALKSIIFGESISCLGFGAIRYCDGLESITIGKNVSEINSYAIQSCYDLTIIRFEGTMEKWNSIKKDTDWLNNCSKVTGILCSDGEIRLY